MLDQTNTKEFPWRPGQSRNNNQKPNEKINKFLVICNGLAHVQLNLLLDATR